jgi:hypothetical protein
MSKGKLCISLVAFFLSLVPALARAEVVVAFYSHDFGNTFPHAFIKLEGETAEGRKVDVNFGFTAKSVTPAVLMGSVPGKIEVSLPKYVESSDRQFTVKISDAKYYELIQLVEKWRYLPQKSYNLNSRNCIHFVGEVGKLLGLKVDMKKELLKKPKSFLLYIKSLNPWLGK